MVGSAPASTRRPLAGHAPRWYGLEPELVEVPLLVKWPGQREGRREGSLVSLVDLFPTLAAAAGVAVSPPDGLPLAEHRGAGGTARRSRVYFEEHESRVHPLGFRRLRLAPDLWGVASLGQRRVVWAGGGQCAERFGGGWRLRSCPDDGARFLTRLRERVGGEVASAQGPAGDLPAQERESLRALGYL